MRVLLLHAFPLDHRMWAAQAQALADAGHDVTAIDLPGFGGTPLLPGEPSLAAVADAVAAGHLDEPAVVAGLSLGGYVLMQLLGRHPQRVLGAMLLDTKAGADAEPAAANRHRIAAVADDDPASLGRLLVTAMLPGLIAPGAPARDQVRAWLEQAPAPAVAWYQRAMAARADSHAALSAFAGPSMVLWGELDEISPSHEQASMLAALRDARPVVVPDAGHLSAVEQPGPVSEAMLACLRDWSARALP